MSGNTIPGWFIFCHSVRSICSGTRTAHFNTLKLSVMPCDIYRGKKSYVGCLYAKKDTSI